jgi:hypothetical protein
MLPDIPETTETQLEQWPYSGFAQSPDTELCRCTSPSHKGTDLFLAARTPAAGSGPANDFRKIHLYGKTEKPTHGHQTTGTICGQKNDGPPRLTYSAR